MNKTIHSPFVCPTCSSENTQRLSVINMLGTSTNTSFGYGGIMGSGGNAGAGMMVTTGKTQNALVVGLNKAKALQWRLEAFRFLHGVSAVFALLFVIAGFASLGEAEGVGGVVLFLFIMWLVLAVLFMVGFHYGVRENALKVREEQELIRDGVLCLRCGHAWVAPLSPTADALRGTV